MKKILFIATGGTIASKPTEQGLAPLLTPGDLLKCVPRIASLCDVETISPMNLDSTNMGPDHWLMLSGCIEREYDRFDGFVISHGTDTMAYTSSALSYLVQRSKKPIVLTGAQKSISLQDTDARTNLLDAFSYAVDPMASGICIVFGGKVITGTRARKSRNKSYDAFASVDYPELALIRDAGILRYIYEPETQLRPTFYHALNRRVALLKLVPGMDADILSYLRERCDALVIEGFGVGGVPNYQGDRFMRGILDWCEAGKPVVMTTQVPHEGSDMALYQVGSQVKAQQGVMEAYNMTLESIMTKLMWILADTRDAGQVRDRFYTPVAHDLLLIG